MSRLNSFIDRLLAQKLLLGAAAEELRRADEDPSGPVVELGLGNGRTYDHLRELLPDRRIVAFDRDLLAHPESTPPREDIVLGDIAVTAPAFAERHGAIAALVHADLGNGVPAYEAELQIWLPGVILALTRRGALVVTSTRLDHPRLSLHPMSSQVASGRYYVYRKL